MTRAVLIGLIALSVGAGALALGWNAYAPAAPGAVVTVADVDAPAARSIFPKVLNR